MKKIYLLSAVVAFLATPVLAGIKMPDVNVSGEILAKDVKTNNTVDFKNYDKNGTPSTYADDDVVGRTRVRVNMNSKLSEGITAHLNLQYGDANWSNIGSRSTITTIEGATQVRHAYLAIKNILGDTLPAEIDLTLGRQGIGKLNRELVLYTDSINAKVVKATYNDLVLTGICALQTEDNSANNGDTDTTIKGIRGCYPLPMPVGKTNLCGYYLRQVANNPNKDSRDINNVLGVKVDGSMKIASTVNYFFEYAKQSGTDTAAGADRKANALRLGGGYKTEIPGLGDVALEGSYMSISGDKENSTTTVGNYTGILPNLNYFSAMQVEGVLKFPANAANSGRKIINVNGSIQPDALSDITLGVSYTRFTSAEKIAVGADKKDALGSEIDLTCTYKYNDKTNIDLIYARFSPGDATKKDGDPASMLKCQLVTKF
ncbi:MAG: alginate export family protein [bacterium]|nr:alginate export family protein [bacterium]